MPPRMPISAIYLSMLSCTFLPINLSANSLTEFSDVPLNEVITKSYPKSETLQISEWNGSTNVVNQKEVVIKGKVFDDTNNPCPGVTVLVKGTQKGTVTDLDGLFEIKVKKDMSQVLQFSFVGMKTQEVKIGKSTFLKIILEPDSEELDEIIVTGYQTLSKERAAGSFGVIKPKALDTKLQGNLSSLLEGQATGVVLDKNGKIEIRGVSTFQAETSPLVVVDGYPIEGGLDMINPDNIENITVLKDGVAASIYGSRAANGVIVVTTVRGKKDEFKVTYKGVFGVTLKPTLDKLNLASTSDYIDAELDLFNQDPNGPNTMSKSNMSRVTWLMMQAREGHITQDQAMAEIDELRKVDGLKQAEKAFFRNKLSHKHNISINGGSEKNRFNAAINYLSNRESMVASDDSRLIVDLKNDWSPSKYLDIAVTANVAYKESSKPVRDWSDLMGYRDNSLIQPYDNLYDPATGLPTDVFSTSTYKIANYQKISGMKDWTYNPIQDLRNEMTTNENLQTRLGGTIRLKIMKGLNIETGGIWTKGSSNVKSIFDHNAYRVRIQYNDATSKANHASHYFPDGSVINESRNINESWTVRTQVNFNRSFDNDKHRVSFLAGNEVRKITFSNNTYATRLGYNETAGSFIPINIMDWNNRINDSDMLMGKSQFYSLQPGEYLVRDNRFVSWYGNGSYEFNNRYILSGSIRLDLTNFFGTDPKYRYKPLWSIGGTWKVSEEEFFNVPWISRFNIRGSYGINGNIALNEGPFLILSVDKYSPVTGGMSYGVQSPPNNQLRWEKTQTTNIGFDLSLLKNRINLSLDYYRKKSSDLLAKDAIDTTTGFGSLTKNTGEMVNNGLEISIGADVIKNKDFLWNTSLNLSTNKNKVNKFKVKRNYAGSWTGTPKMAEGYAAHSLFGFRYAGLNDKGETLAYKANGEVDLIGKLKPEDIIYLGTVRPKTDLSFTNTFKYQDFQLSFMFIAKFGHIYRKDCFSGSNYQNRHVSERWQKPGDEKTKIYPKLLSWNMDMFDFPYTDIMTGKADYLKLRDLTLSYNLPKNLLMPLGLSAAKVYFQSRNLFTVTSKGVDIDPEVAELNMTGGTNAFTNAGFTSLPLRPEFYFGLSFTF